uniref:Uncharacterized protein n=1 Tax=Rhizophora mucronata TaxID=61149 RepID=A0A2P2PSG0_RHIMU
MYFPSLLNLKSGVNLGTNLCDNNI